MSENIRSVSDFVVTICEPETKREKPITEKEILACNQKYINLVLAGKLDSVTGLETLMTHDNIPPAYQQIIIDNFLTFFKENHV